MRLSFMREFLGVPLELTDSERKAAAGAFSASLLDRLLKDVRAVERDSNLPPGQGGNILLGLHLCTRGLEQVIELTRATTQTGILQLEAVSITDNSETASSHTYKRIHPAVKGTGLLTRYDINDLQGHTAGFLADVRQLFRGERPYVNNTPEPDIGPLVEDSVDLTETRALFEFIDVGRASGTFTPIGRLELYRAQGFL